MIKKILKITALLFAVSSVYGMDVPPAEMNIVSLDPALQHQVIGKIASDPVFSFIQDTDYVYIVLSGIFYLVQMNMVRSYQCICYSVDEALHPIFTLLNSNSDACHNCLYAGTSSNCLHTV